MVCLEIWRERRVDDMKGRESEKGMRGKKRGGKWEMVIIHFPCLDVLKIRFKYRFGPLFGCCREEGGGEGNGHIN